MVMARPRPHRSPMTFPDHVASAPTSPPRLLAVHPVLATQDVARSVAFFEALGFTCRFLDDPTAPRYAAVARDACELHVQWGEPSPGAGTHDRPVVRVLVQHVDALYAAWHHVGAVPGPTAGGSPYAAPADTPWGTREFHVHDPGGNGLQFYQPR